MTEQTPNKPEKRRIVTLTLGALLVLGVLLFLVTKHTATVTFSHPLIIQEFHEVFSRPDIFVSGVRVRVATYSGGTSFQPGDTFEEGLSRIEKQYDDLLLQQDAYREIQQKTFSKTATERFNEEQALLRQALQNKEIRFTSMDVYTRPLTIAQIGHKFPVRSTSYRFVRQSMNVVYSGIGRAVDFFGIGQFINSFH